MSPIQRFNTPSTDPILKQKFLQLRTCHIPSKNIHCCDTSCSNNKRDDHRIIDKKNHEKVPLGMKSVGTDTRTTIKLVSEALLNDDVKQVLYIDCINAFPFEEVTLRLGPPRPQVYDRLKIVPCLTVEMLEKVVTTMLDSRDDVLVMVSGLEVLFQGQLDHGAGYSKINDVLIKLRNLDVDTVVLLPESDASIVKWIQDYFIG